ncbi:MAG: porin, partial [Hyphomicrobiaceae bacterium]
MYGGLLKTASAAAILAAAGLFGASSAKAADLGGDCCADLEERVAELEATTVRRGNRKVSVTLSGFVAHNVMYWDDGIRSDTYIGDGGNYGSRFRFVGSAKISPTLSAGFL